MAPIYRKNLKLLNIIYIEEVRSMVNLEDIPAEMRWAIAAKSASAMPFAFSMAFQEIIGKEKFDEVARKMWIEGGKEAKSLADMIRLPIGNAIEVDDSWGLISSILYGPEIKWDVIEENEDLRITRITGCSFLNRAMEMGIDPNDGFGGCQAYNRSIVENLNPKYTQRFESGMCLGAPFCRSIVELKTLP
jgi:hypothetical protein